jgi:hypothetical protein
MLVYKENKSYKNKRLSLSYKENKSYKTQSMLYLNRQVLQDTIYAIPKQASLTRYKSYALPNKVSLIRKNLCLTS